MSCPLRLPFIVMPRHETILMSSISCQVMVCFISWLFFALTCFVSGSLASVEVCHVLSNHAASCHVTLCCHAHVTWFSDITLRVVCGVMAFLLLSCVLCSPVMQRVVMPQCQCPSLGPSSATGLTPRQKKKNIALVAAPVRAYKFQCGVCTCSVVASVVVVAAHQVGAQTWRMPT